MRILAADIGGTHCRFELVDIIDGQTISRFEDSYSSQSSDDFQPLLLRFIESANSQKPIEAACLAIAGPVVDHDDYQSANVTNLPWSLDSRTLETNTGIAKIYFINDFQAVGYAVEHLQKTELCTLQEGQPIKTGTCLVVGAGTGFGVGQLIWQQDRYKVYPCEAGHGQFAPRNSEQLALVAYLQQQVGNVSVEHILSGAGLVNIHRYVIDATNTAASNELTAAIIEADDVAATISAYADKDASAAHALQLFIDCYGACTGNLALVNIAYGGIYIAGGIAPKIIEQIRRGTFIEAFNDKGKMADLTKRLPVHVVTHPNPGLMGAAYYASNPIKA